MGSIGMCRITSVSYSLMAPEPHCSVSGLPLVAVFLITIFNMWRSMHRNPLRDIPGPFLARWTPLWLAFQARRGKRYIAVDQLHKVRILLHEWPDSSDI